MKKNMLSKIGLAAFAGIFIMGIIGFIFFCIEPNIKNNGAMSQDEIDIRIILGIKHIKENKTKQLGIIKYYQNKYGDSWINDVMKYECDTIKKSGCTLTVFTMIHNYFEDTLDNPGTVNKKLDKYACLFDYTNAAKAYGYCYSGFIRCNTNLEYTAFVASYLNEELPIMIQLKSADGVLHYVLAVGYTELSININDPDINKNYSQLADYINNGYTIEKIHIFEK